MCFNFFLVTSHISFSAIHFSFFTMAKRSASEIRFIMDQYTFTIVLTLLISLFQADELLAFTPSPSFRTSSGVRNTHHHQQHHGYRQLQKVSDTELVEATKQEISLWKPPGRWWEPRIHIDDVKVGQNFTGVIFQELLNGTTGPKGE
jgi:hypothetical protein